MKFSRFISPYFSNANRIFPQKNSLNSPASQNSSVFAFLQYLNAFSSPLSFRNYASTSASPEVKPASSERVSAIVDEISGLSLLEVADLTEVLREKLNVSEMPIMTVMMPGMGFGDLKGAAKGGPGAKAAEEKKAEKTAFDVKLEAFDAAAKIKVIKEVRTFTNLGLKEAKDLVEKAPTLLKKGVTKEEAETIIAKMKEIGAKVSME